MKNTCVNCFYYQEASGVHGECHRNAPFQEVTLYEDKERFGGIYRAKNTRWVSVGHYDWCGEWKDKV